jgi:hypothetical protein
MVEIDERALALPSASAKWIWVETVEVASSDQGANSVIVR